jgi:hypothetical protein
MDKKKAATTTDNIHQDRIRTAENVHMASLKKHLIDLKRHLWYNGFSNKTGGRGLTCIPSFYENFYSIVYTGLKYIMEQVEEM